MERGDREDKLHARGTKFKTFALSYLLSFCFSWCFTLSLTSQINRYNNHQESLFQAPNRYIHLSLLFNFIYIIFHKLLLGHDIISLCEGLGPGCLREYRRGGDSKVFLGESHGVETRSFEEVMYPGLDTHAPEPSQSQIKEPFN